MLSENTKAKFNALKRQLDAYRPLDTVQLQRLEESIRYEHVWSSNSIEGNSLTRNETVQILNSGLTVGGASLKDTLEAVDLNQAYEYMMDLAARKQPLTELAIRDLNRLATLQTAKVRSDAGKYRVVDVFPNGLPNHPYTPSFEVPGAMRSLIEWSDSAQREMQPVEYAAELHFRFVSIHPFVDGNGRTARLLMNLSLTQSGYPVINIQPNANSRSAYMDSLETSRVKGDSTPFQELVAKYAMQTLNDRIAILRANEESIETARSQTGLPQRDTKRHRRMQNGQELER